MRFCFLSNFFFNNFLFRILLAIFFTVFISIKLNNYFLFFCKKNKIYQFVRYNISKNHLSKVNVPTMGGLIIFISVFISFFLFVYLDKYIVLFFFVILMNVIIGFVDDCFKIFYCNFKGLSIFSKIFYQSIVSIIFIYFFYNNNVIMFNKINIPILNKNIYIGIFYPILLYFIMISTTNSVNLTDGLDGLVILPVIFSLLFCLVVSLFSGNLYLSKILKIPYLYYSHELIVVNVIMLSALIVFFPYNFYPARIFLGDVGSLFLGSFISVMFILLHKELYLLIVGFLFVLEGFSVILQILYIKLFCKRVFLMAPIHHHYELKGFTEIKIVTWFWVFSFFSFLVSLLIFGIV